MESMNAHRILWVDDDPDVLESAQRLFRSSPWELVTADSFDQAKKKLERENIIKDVRAKRYYEKPCERRRRKAKVQAFTQMLRRRYAE